MAVAQVNGTELFYTEVGQGVPCLVMHGGLGVDHTQFREWLDPLGDLLRLVYYDHRGNGCSGRPPIETHSNFAPLELADAGWRALSWSCSMTCRDVVEFLADYLSGELPSEQRSRFEEHLKECAECVAYLKSYEETVKLAKEAVGHPERAMSDEVPEELVQAILAARGKPR